MTTGYGSIPLSSLQAFTEAARVSATNLNPGYTTLAAAVTGTGGTSISVTSAAGFPGSGPFYVMIDAEQMQVTAGFGTTSWTVSRGANGTTAATHASGALVFQSATSLIPIEPIMFEPMVDRYMPALMRNSFVAFYESMIVSERSELKGLKMPQTFEVLPNLLGFAVKGGVVPSQSPTGVYTWDFSPTLAADDISGLGAEMGSDTAFYHIAALYCDQLVLEFVRGTDAAQATVDFIGQMAFQMGARTPGLTRLDLNMINPAYTSTFIDSATIGTTPFNDMSSAKATLKNGIQQLYFLNGKLYSTAIARPTRALDVELVQWFDDSTELSNAMNAVGNGVERKLRLAATGTQIASTGVNRSLTLDAYLYWRTFPFKAENETWRVTYTGTTVYDDTAGRDWKMTLVNDLAAAA